MVVAGTHHPSSCDRHVSLGRVRRHLEQLQHHDGECEQTPQPQEARLGVNDVRIRYDEGGLGLGLGRVKTELARGHVTCEIRRSIEFVSRVHVV